MTHEELVLFGKRVRNSRDAVGFTQEEVAEKIGISLRFYQMLERGEKSMSLDTLIILSKTLNISIDYLLLGDLAGTLGNPVADLYDTLTPSQREDAAKILELYAKACKQQ